MRKQIIVLILMSLLFVAVCSGAGADPRVELDWNHPNDAYDFYIGMDYKYHSIYEGKPQSASQLASFWANVTDSADTPVWDIQLISGNIQYEEGGPSSPNSKGIELKEMPTAPTDATFRVTCSVSGASATKEYTIHFVNCPNGLPTGIVKQFSDPLIVSEGDQILIPAVFANNWSIAGYDTEVYLGGGNNIWDGVRQGGPDNNGNTTYYARNAGTYDANVTVKCANVEWMERFTLKVADQSGYIPDPIPDPGPGPGPGQGVMIQGSFRQSNPQAGQQIDLDWSVSGGTAPYTVEIEWVAHESCLQKVLKTESFTTSSGTASFTPPSLSIDQVVATITVTDSNQNSSAFWCHTSLSDWEHGQGKVASYSVNHDMDYVQVGQQVSGSWSIDPGQYTISNVRYRWVTSYKDSEGTRQKTATDWTVVGNVLAGKTAAYTTTQAGNAYLDVAFDANDGWGNPGGNSDPIQVLNPGEAPLTAEITITPEKPKTGNDVTVAWNVGGATADTKITVEWQFNPRNNGNTDSDTISPASATGSRKLNFSNEGWLSAHISVWDEDRDLQFDRSIWIEVTEPSGLILTVSPANPQLNQEVTISWEITRPTYIDAGIDVELIAGNMTKYATGINGMDKIRTEKTGSATFTPKEGDSFKVTGYIWTDNNSYREELEPIPLTGSWNAPDPVSVNVTYTVQQPRGAGGLKIIADYTIGGGTGNISDIRATWVRYEPNGGYAMLHEKKLGGEASGELVYTPVTSGEYALVFEVYDWESGWQFYQDVTAVSDRVSVENVSQTALGIDVFTGLPEAVDPDEGYEFGWDVTGGDSSGFRETKVVIKTDDGIVLENGYTWAFTNYFSIPLWGIGADSRYVIIELTPRDDTSTGETARFEIPINRCVNGRLILPRGLTKIESEAFLNVAAEEIDLPDGVTEIGENAFPSGVTLIVGPGSEWADWAMENGYEVCLRE